MKVWLFYKNRKDDDEILYGVTNNKKIAKKFINERNMKNFCIEIENMEKDEYASYCNSNEHRSAVLSEYKLATVKNGDHTSSNFYFKKVVMSYWEHQIIDDFSTSAFNETHEFIGMPIPIIFKNKYIKCLKILEYNNHFILYALPYLPDEVENLVAEKLHVEDEYNTIDIENDELAIFINTCRESF